MSKIIKVEYCNDVFCPYYDYILADMFVQGGSYCDKLGEYVNNPSYKIPYNCPLENSDG